MNSRSGDQSPGSVQQERIEAALQSCLGPIGIQRTGPKLNERAELDVVRVFLEPDERSPRTVVIKTLRRVEDQASALELAEEATVYRFLMLRRHRFDRCARLLGHTGDTLILEDLGEDDERVSRGDEVTVPVAETIARLHAATRDGFATYLRLRSEAGLVGDANRLRTEFVQAGFAAGQRFLGRWAAAAGHEAATLGDALAAAAADVENPREEWRVLIHDDFATRRQVIHRADGSLTLLDFGRACFGHVLIDPCRLYLGQRIWRSDLGAMDFTRAGFGPELFRHHRLALEEFEDQTMPETAWRRQTASALLYVATEVLGRCVLDFHYVPMTVPFPHLAPSLLILVANVLAEQARQEPLARALEALTRCSLPPPPEPPTA